MIGDTTRLSLTQRLQLLIQNKKEGMEEDHTHSGKTVMYANVSQ